MQGGKAACSRSHTGGLSPSFLAFHPKGLGNQPELISHVTLKLHQLS